MLVAGIHGRGFGVVAEEVRKLAEQSKGSTIKISDLITKIEVRVEEAFSTMQKESRLVDNTVDFVEKTQLAFEEILKAIEEMNDKISVINVLSKNQANISNDMSNAMEDFSKNIMKNSESAEVINMNIESQVSIFEEIGASIQELNSMAENLREQTRSFKTK